VGTRGWLCTINLNKMITYKEIEETIVYLDGKKVGIIKRVIGGYQYFPKGSKKGGEVFFLLSSVKKSLESE